MEALSTWLEGELRAARRAPGEWGLRLDDVGGWPCDLGLRAHEGLFRVQAFALAPGSFDVELALHANRRAELVRLGTTGSGELWITGEVPLAGLAVASADRLLGSVVSMVERVRLGASAAG